MVKYQNFSSRKRKLSVPKKNRATRKNLTRKNQWRLNLPTTKISIVWIKVTAIVSILSRWSLYFDRFTSFFPPPPRKSMSGRLIYFSSFCMTSEKGWYMRWRWPSKRKLLCMLRTCLYPFVALVSFRWIVQCRSPERHGLKTYTRGSILKLFIEMQLSVFNVSKQFIKHPFQIRIF